MFNRLVRSIVGPLQSSATDVRDRVMRTPDHSENNNGLPVAGSPAFPHTGSVYSKTWNDIDYHQATLKTTQEKASHCDELLRSSAISSQAKARSTALRALCAQQISMINTFTTTLASALANQVCRVYQERYGIARPVYYADIPAAKKIEVENIVRSYSLSGSDVVAVQAQDLSIKEKKIQIDQMYSALQVDLVQR